jgi:hypothetical protein
MPSSGKTLKCRICSIYQLTKDLAYLDYSFMLSLQLTCPKLQPVLLIFSYKRKAKNWLSKKKIDFWDAHRVLKLENFPYCNSLLTYVWMLYLIGSGAVTGLIVIRLYHLYPSFHADSPDLICPSWLDKLEPNGGKSLLLSQCSIHLSVVAW